MTGNRLSDYLDHVRRAAADACSFVEGLSKDEFPGDKRTQQSVIGPIVARETAEPVLAGMALLKMGRKCRHEHYH